MRDICKNNQQLSEKTPEDIVRWAIEQSKNPILTTNFGPFEAVILHMVTGIKPDIKTVWVDSGYNSRHTYQIAAQLIEQLTLNIDVYTPKITAARQDMVLGGIPSVDDEAHALFTEQFKLEPFTRAIQEIKPDIWFSAVRHEQTSFRQGLNIVEQGPDGIIKIAPLLHWKQADMQVYLDKHGLPNTEKYFDPTKVMPKRECGLHTKL